jgi:hypothetical protein
MSELIFWLGRKFLELLGLEVLQRLVRAAADELEELVRRLRERLAKREQAATA